MALQQLEERAEQQQEAQMNKFVLIGTLLVTMRLEQLVTVATTLLIGLHLHRQQEGPMLSQAELIKALLLKEALEIHRLKVEAVSQEVILRVLLQLEAHQHHPLQVDHRHRHRHRHHHQVREVHQVVVVDTEDSNK